MKVVGNFRCQSFMEKWIPHDNELLISAQTEHSVATKIATDSCNYSVYPQAVARLENKTRQEGASRQGGLGHASRK